MKVQKYKNCEWLRHKYWREGLSGIQIATAVNVSPRTIYDRMEKCNIRRRSKSEAMSGERHPLWGKKHSLEARRKMSKTRKGKQQGKENPSWKGGRIVCSKNGYIKRHRTTFSTTQQSLLDDMFIKQGPKKANYVLEHRAMMALVLGRPLKSWEKVHHINKIKTDNRIKNLQLVDHHRRQICPRCGWPMETS